MTTKTRRGMNRRKRMGYRLIVLTVMCLLVTGFYAKHRLQQKNAAYQKQEEQLMAQIEEEEQRSKDIEGRIDSMAYSEVTDFHKAGASILGRLFK